MKKRILSLVLALCLVVPCAFSLAACNGNTPPPEMTNEELSQVYNDVAVQAWAKIGVDDPTQTQASALSVTIPDKKVETTVPTEIANINMNANSMAGLIYMVGLLYSNENFETTNGIAKFNATIDLEGQSFEQNYALNTSIDQTKDKLYLEAIVTVGGVGQYSTLEVDYDFDTETLKAFRYCANIMGDFVDMALTADNKYMWYETSDVTDEYAVAFLQKRAAFETAAEGVTALTQTFDNEVQTYMDVLQGVIADMT